MKNQDNLTDKFYELQRNFRTCSCGRRAIGISRKYGSICENHKPPIEKLEELPLFIKYNKDGNFNKQVNSLKRTYENL